MKIFLHFLHFHQITLFLRSHLMNLSPWLHQFLLFHVMTGYNLIPKFVARAYLTKNAADCERIIRISLTYWRDAMFSHKDVRNITGDLFVAETWFDQIRYTGFWVPCENEYQTDFWDFILFTCNWPPKLLEKYLIIIIIM